MPAIPISPLYQAALQLQAKNWPNATLPPLAFFTDYGIIPNQHEILQHIPHPLLVIIRDYDHPERRHYIATIANICHQRSLPFFIAKDVLLAKELGATGVHIPHGLLNTDIHHECNIHQLLISTSIHDDASFADIQSYSPSWSFLSPIFPTRSHPNTPPIAPAAIQQILKKSPFPIYALGGITSQNISELRTASFSGIATIRGMIT